MQTLVLPPGKSSVVTALPVSDLVSGVPGLLQDGAVPAWSPQDPTIATVSNVAAGGLSATVTATMIPGSTLINVVSQAPNSATISTSFLVTVQEVAAVGFLFTFGPIT